MSVRSSVFDATALTQQMLAAMQAMIPAAVTRSQSSATRSIVTASNQQGYQISATKDALGSYSVSISTTATIGGSSSGTIVLEIAATNSTTPSDWTEISRLTNSQNITLAIALQSVQIIAGNLTGFVPAGYYARLRSINNSGSPSFLYVTGQEATFNG